MTERVQKKVVRIQPVALEASERGFKSPQNYPMASHQ